jgi:sulfite reductase alpha subunit-like flavoprotein
VFALGNSSYPSFCGFGTWLDSAFCELSGRRLLKIAYGDELGDRETEYKKWSQMAYKQACLEANLDLHYEPNRAPDAPEKIVTKWVPIATEPFDYPLSDVVCNGTFSKHSYIFKI